jgi:hypothetical protein
MKIDEPGRKEKPISIQIFDPRRPVKEGAKGNNTPPLHQQVPLHDGILRNYPGIFDYQTVGGTIHNAPFSIVYLSYVELTSL